MNENNFWRSLRSLLGGNGGFTLLEVMVATALLSLGIGMVGTGVFQVLDAQRNWQSDVSATKELRHVGSWFGGDVLNTDVTNLVSGAAAVNTVTLNTFGGDTVTYNLSGQDLIRTYDNGSVLAQNILASKVVSVAFSRLSNLVTMVLVVEAEGGTTETITLNTNLR